MVTTANGATGKVYAQGHVELWFNLNLEETGAVTTLHQGMVDHVPITILK